MARSNSGFYSTIEYIGPRPQKPKRKNFFGGWVIIAIAIGMACWFGRPIVTTLKAANAVPTARQADLRVSTLIASKSQGDRLAGAALSLLAEPIAYDSSYYKIPFPGGDVPSGRGMAADVVIRSFRSLKLDLQQLVNEDMSIDFRRYPQLWDATAPDPSIDHRRIPNLQKFFERHAEVIKVTRNPNDYVYGDVVIWSLSSGDTHIGIIVPGPGERSHEPWVIHQLNAGLQWENVLFDYKVHRHFRYPNPQNQ